MVRKIKDLVSSQDVNINYIDTQERCTTLHLAIERKDDFRLISYLLRNGVDPKIRNICRLSSLAQACILLREIKAAIEKREREIPVEGLMKDIDLEGLIKCKRLYKHIIFTFYSVKNGTCKKAVRIQNLVLLSV